MSCFLRHLCICVTFAIVCRTYLIIRNKTIFLRCQLFHLLLSRSFALFAFAHIDWFAVCRIVFGFISGLLTWLVELSIVFLSLFPLWACIFCRVRVFGVVSFSRHFFLAMYVLVSVWSMHMHNCNNWIGCNDPFPFEQWENKNSNTKQCVHCLHVYNSWDL